MCTSICFVELGHRNHFRSRLSVASVSAFLLECRCHTTASEGRATDWASRARPCWVLEVPITTLPEGSRVRCVLRQLLVRELHGVEHASRFRHLFVMTPLQCSRRPLGASTGSARIHKCQHVPWLDPSFQFVVVSDSIHLRFSCSFMPQDSTSRCGCRASIIPHGTELAHTHDGSLDFAHLSHVNQLDTQRQAASEHLSFSLLILSDSLTL